LDEASFERDWGYQEQGVECWAVEAFAEVGASGDDKQWRSAGIRLETGESGGTGLRASAATQHNRIAAAFAQDGRDPFGSVRRTV